MSRALVYIAASDGMSRALIIILIVIAISMIIKTYSNHDCCCAFSSPMRSAAMTRTPQKHTATKQLETYAPETNAQCRAKVSAQRLSSSNRLLGSPSLLSAHGNDLSVFHLLTVFSAHRLYLLVTADVNRLATLSGSSYSLPSFAFSFFLRSLICCLRSPGVAFGNLLSIMLYANTHAAMSLASAKSPRNPAALCRAGT